MTDDAVAGGGPGAPRPGPAAPVRRLTVLYDARCSLCAFLRDWLVRQPQLVPLDLVPAGSDEARRRHPDLDHGATLDEITVVGDAGQVYRGPAAWIVTLWALREHRPLAHRLSTPSGARLARGAVLAAAKWREGPWGSAAQGGGGGRVVVRPERGLDVQLAGMRQRHPRHPVTPGSGTPTRPDRGGFRPLIWHAPFQNEAGVGTLPPVLHSALAPTVCQPGGSPRPPGPPSQKEYA